MTKKLLYIPLGLLLAFIAAAVILPFVINPNNFKDALVKQVAQRTGYAIDFQGDLSFRMLPTVRLSVENVSISSAIAGSKPFAKAGKMEIGAKLLPLLGGWVEVTKIYLREPQINLAMDAKGRSNWKSSLTVNKKTALDDLQTERARETVAPTVLINDLEIINGSVSYKDESNAQNITLSELNLNASMNSLESPFALKADAVWNGEPVSLETKIGGIGLLALKRDVPAKVLFDSGKLRFKADGKFYDRQFTGDMNVESKSLAEAGSWLSGTAKKADAMAIEAKIQGKATCSMTGCDFKDTAVEVNDSTLSGNFSAHMDGARPEIKADLKGAKLDVTRYMDKKTAGLGIISEAYADSARWSNAPIDFSVLSMLNANIAIKVDQFIADKLTMGQVTLAGKISSGALNTTMSSDDLYKGKGSVNLSRSSTGLMNFTMKLNGVDMAPLLHATMDSDRFSGTGNMGMQLNSSGASQHALVSNLAGSGSVAMSNGSFKGVDILSFVKGARSALSLGDTSSKTDFTSLDASYTIKQGIISNDDLIVKSSILQLAGSGTANLPDYTINYKLVPEVGASAKGSGLAVPILVTGSLERPTFAPDVASIATEILKNPEKLKDNVKNAKGAIKDLLKNQKGLLKGL